MKTTISLKKILPTVLLCGIALALLVPATTVVATTGSEPDLVTEAATSQNVSELLNKTKGTGAMNKIASYLVSASLLLLPVILVVLVIAGFYNGIVNREEKVYVSWSQVESNFQRRADLIPNLVETVSRYLEHEREVLVDVSKERSAGLNPLTNALERLEKAQQQADTDSNVELEDQNALARLAAAQKTLSGSVKQLIAVSEDYPDLRSADQFMALQAQLEGTENRINVARMEFNKTVGEYNSAIRRLPGNLIAGMSGFKRKAYFETEEDQDAPVAVQFETP